MDSDLLISVIIPVHNTSKYLNTCLDSILKNDYKNIEIIVVEDNSDDDSLNILKAYEKKYKNISLHHNNKTLGQSVSRNIGLAYAKGDYISFIDSDDYISYTMYFNMVNQIIKNDFPDVIETDLIFVKDNHYYGKDLSFANTNKSDVINIKEDILNVSPSVCNKLFRKDLIDDYRFINTKWEDIAFTTNMYIKSNKIVRTFNKDYFYRKTLSGVSGINLRPNTKITEIFDVCDDIMKYAIDMNKLDLYYKELLIICFSAILKRVEEVDYWDIEESKKEDTRNMMYKYLYLKYGVLNDEIKKLLIPKVQQEIVEEYDLFTKKYKKINKK